MGQTKYISVVKCNPGLCAVFFVSALAGTARAQLTVDAPINNSVVNSPLYLQAEAPSCQSGTTASMAYSIDSDSDVVFSGAKSLQTTVPMPSGSHTLHVKAWSNTGNLCEQDISLGVGGGVTVSAPARGAQVNSPFPLQAQATTCGGQATTSMGYSFDSGTVTMFQGSTSLNTSASASAGAHLLRVKAWGNSGAYCETDGNLTVNAPSGLVPAPGASSYVHLENDGTYTGSYYSCGGASGSDSNLWQTQPDCNTHGTPTGSTSLQSTPTYQGEANSREFTMNYTSSGGGVRWFDAKGADDAATHFQYDAFVYIVDNTQVMNIEMDTNHAITSPTATVYIMATQCNLAEGLWQVTVNGSWVNTNASCTASQVASGVWHHFQIQAHHDASGGSGVYYDAVALDGNVTKITSCTNPSSGASVSCQSTSENLGWGGVIGPNFQLDGNGPSGTATAYVDAFTLFYW
jgi:hypothetical protein